MTFLEQELRKIFGKDMGLSDIRTVGNACYGRLPGGLCMKANFSTDRVADQYVMLKITVLNRREGVVDSISLHFSDLWGRKKTGNPNFRDGVYPHIWKNGGNTEWYVYKPDEADYMQLSRAARDYLDVFREPEQEPQMGQEMC